MRRSPGWRRAPASGPLDESGGLERSRRVTGPLAWRSPPRRGSMWRRAPASGPVRWRANPTQSPRPPVPKTQRSQTILRQGFGWRGRRGPQSRGTGNRPDCSSNGDRTTEVTESWRRAPASAPLDEPTWNRFATCSHWTSRTIEGQGTGPLAGARRHAAHERTVFPPPNEVDEIPKLWFLSVRPG